MPLISLQFFQFFSIQFNHKVVFTRVVCSPTDHMEDHKILTMASHQNSATSPMCMDMSRVSQTSSLNMFPITISMGIPAFLLSSITVRSSLQSCVRKWNVTCKQRGRIAFSFGSICCYFHKKPKPSLKFLISQYTVPYAFLKSDIPNKSKDKLIKKLKSQEIDCVYSGFYNPIKDTLLHL